MQRDRMGPGVKEYRTEITTGWSPTEGEITVFLEYHFILLLVIYSCRKTLSVCEGEVSVFAPQFSQIKSL